MAIWDRLTSFIAGGAVARASSDAVTPVLEPVRQQAWKKNRLRVLGENTAARLVAEGLTDLPAAQEEASRSGLNENRLEALVQLAYAVPGTAELMFLWRLGKIDKAEWEAGMRKLAVRQDWIDHVAETFSVPLTAEQAAVAVHRSVIKNQGQLPNLPPVGDGKVPRYPEVSIDAYESAKAYGVGNDQLDALTRILGLPPGMDLVARMVFRGILDRNDFDLAAAQSNRRREWADYEFEGYRQIPTAEQFVEARLRGWIDQQAMYAGTALHGMSEADTDLEYRIHRRPLTVRQIATGLARGGKFKPEPDEIDDPFDAAVHQANLGPEWYDLAKANAYSYPSLFQLNRLVTAGAITVAEAVDWSRKAGLAHEVVAALEKYWHGLVGTGGDPHIAKAQTQLWSTLHRSYIAEETDDTTAATTLGELGIDASSQQKVLALWQSERKLVRKQLTPAQVKKAYKSAVTNPATGVAWTKDDALVALLDRGYSLNDATTYLDT